MVKCAYCFKEIREEESIKAEFEGKTLYFCSEEHLEKYLGKAIGKSC